MQNWKNYFLNQAKQYGICCHQKDMDSSSEQYYPYKQNNVPDFIKNDMEQKKQLLDKIKNDFNFLVQQYEEQKKNYQNNFYEYQNYLKQKIAVCKQCYQKIGQLECNESSINNVIKLSCLSKLKVKIYDYQDQLTNYKFEQFEDYGTYVKQKSENLEREINSYNKMIKDTQNRVAIQNQHIDQLYKVIGLNADDFYMVKFDYDELNKDFRKSRV